jgi:hypothetical protein
MFATPLSSRRSGRPYRALFARVPALPALVSELVVVRYIGHSLDPDLIRNRRTAHIGRGSESSAPKQCDAI